MLAISIKYPCTDIFSSVLTWFGCSTYPQVRREAQTNNWSTMGRLSPSPALHPQHTNWKPGWNDTELQDIQRWARSALATLLSTESSKQAVLWNEIPQVSRAHARCAHYLASLAHSPTPLCGISHCSMKPCLQSINTILCKPIRLVDWDGQGTVAITVVMPIKSLPGSLYTLLYFRFLCLICFLSIPLSSQPILTINLLSLWIHLTGYFI